MQRSRLTEITKLVPDDTRITKFCVTYLCTYVSTERIRTWIRTCEDSSPAQVHDAYIPVQRYVTQNFVILVFFRCSAYFPFTYMSFTAISSCLRTLSRQALPPISTIDPPLHARAVRALDILVLMSIVACERP